jgi:hypothetical protein
MSPAVKGWSMATGSSRSSGWERVHVGPRTGFPHNRSGAADIIRVAVSENQVLELVWRTAKPADRPEYGCLLTRETGVDQRQPVVALDQEGRRDFGELDAVGHFGELGAFPSGNGADRAARPSCQGGRRNEGDYALVAARSG